MVRPCGYSGQKLDLLTDNQKIGLASICEGERPRGTVRLPRRGKRARLAEGTLEASVAKPGGSTESEVARLKLTGEHKHRTLLAENVFDAE